MIYSIIIGIVTQFSEINVVGASLNKLVQFCRTILCDSDPVVLRWTASSGFYNFDDEQLTT